MKPITEALVRIPVLDIRSAPKTTLIGGGWILRPMFKLTGLEYGTETKTGIKLRKESMVQR